jgi:MFS family permease
VELLQVNKRIKIENSKYKDSKVYLSCKKLDHVTWRWSFYINLPLGAITIGVMVFLLHIPRTKGSLLQKLKRIDYAGTIVMVGATIALLLPLNWGGNEYAWNSPVIITLLVVGGAGYLLFAFIEAKFAIEPVVPRKCVQ